jgi:hypothetical protein
VASKLLLTGVAIAAFVASLAAQGGGAGGGTRLDEFASKLKLDAKTQVPALQPIFADGAKAAAPLAQEMLTLRQKLVNLELVDNAAEIAATKVAYADAAARMAGVEVAVFQKVYALLQPYQQSKAPDAFDYMAGFFQASGPAGGRGGAGGGRGGRGGGE